MRHFILVLPLLAAGCATPREACIASASSDLRTLNALIAESQSTIARGFAYETRQEVVTRTEICTLRNSDETFTKYPCDKVETIERREPVAVDLNAEKAKLDSLIERQASLQTQVNAAVQQCVAVHPE